MRWLFLALPILAYAHPEPAPFPRPPEKEITVEAQAWVKNCVAEPYIEVDFIYWKVREEGLNYTRTGVGPNQTSSGKLYEVAPDGEPGFRAALGLNLAHDGWDLLLRYTWIYASEKESERQTDPLWISELPGFLFTGLDRATAQWNLHTNVLDLEWGRNYYISRFLTLRPFFGLKGYWNDQGFKIHYIGLTDAQPRVSAEQKIQMSQDTWGGGLRFGMNTAWYFAHHWSVFADMALSAAWSKFDIERRDREIIPSTNTDETVLYLDYDRYGMVPILELAAGLRWEMWFNDDSYHALIQAGWEEQMWWGFHRNYVLFNVSENIGNLQYQGLTLRFRFDF